ncbi:MAG: DUF3307 domain-containing protein [Mariniphaga sp.]|nr:DUF3307 domain-containing protein [Mariniphaga sp.]
MSLADLIILQFCAHLLADFTFQSEVWAKDKNTHGFKSKNLRWHVLVVFVISWLLSFQYLFVLASLVIAVFHLLIDGFKKKIVDNKKIAGYTFFIDQTLHLLVLVGVILLFNNLFPISPFIQLPINTYWLLIIAGYLFCTKPANIFIREVFKAYEMAIVDESRIAKAGRLIGITERIIALTLILYGQFAAVGFIIAGKSILRFKDDDTPKTEYVLIGTLLSFGVAIITGIGIKMLK